MTRIGGKLLLIAAFISASFRPVSAQDTASAAAYRFTDIPDRYIPARGQLAGFTLGGCYVLGMSLLYSTWYRDYPLGKFHFFNDVEEWRQMDKIGHLGSGYYLSRLGSGLFRWTGLPGKKADAFGALAAVTFMSTIEVFDGFAVEWGFSTWDFAANGGGVALFLAQQRLWDEQRISIKFSYHDDPIADYRPEVLGTALADRVLKNYNGQTYWLSFNLSAFSRQSGLPTWLNMAFGYGAGGMLSSTGSGDFIQPGFKSYRQFYLSPDIEWSRIPTRSGFLKTFFKVISFIKLPAPALEFREGGRWIVHGLHF